MSNYDPDNSPRIEVAGNPKCPMSNYDPDNSLYV